MEFYKDAIISKITRSSKINICPLKNVYFQFNVIRHCAKKFLHEFASYWHHPSWPWTKPKVRSRYIGHGERRLEGVFIRTSDGETKLDHVIRPISGMEMQID